MKTMKQYSYSFLWAALYMFAVSYLYTCYLEINMYNGFCFSIFMILFTWGLLLCYYVISTSFNYIMQCIGYTIQCIVYAITNNTINKN